MRRVPIRLRVAGAFALAMAVVLAGTAWFLYARLGSHLATALDRELRVRAQDMAALVQQQGGSLSAEGAVGSSRRVRATRSSSTPAAAILDATRPLRTAPLLSDEELRVARQETTFANRSVRAGARRAVASSSRRPSRARDAGSC